MSSNIEIDILSVGTVKVIVDDDFGALLNELHGHGIYKRLHLYFFNDLQDISENVPMGIVEKVAFELLPMNVASMPFVNLKELYINRIPESINMEAVARVFGSVEHLGS